ncbi:carboxypeptidase-like regulatory domain-containing protein [Flavobacterium hauense]
MTPEAKGRFCASCQKTVFDFTNSSDREIATILKNTENACGRFRTTQLERDLVVPKEKSTIWIAASAAIVSFLTIGNHTISAQTPVNTEQRVTETDDIIGKVAPPQKRIITGTVVDSEQFPISGADVIIKGTGKGVKTDIDGKFSIDTKKNDILEVSYVSMIKQDIVINNDSNILIKLIDEIQKDIVVEPYHRSTEQTGTIGAITTITTTTYTQKRTFFGRVFHFIGNWFR